MTLYARIVLGLPADGPFDYSIPDVLAGCARIGCRVRINFRNKKTVGYIVSLGDSTEIASVKPVIDVIDKHEPLLSEAFLELTRQLSLYYCCSWGEAIEAGLPMVLRKGRIMEDSPRTVQCADGSLPARISILHDRDGCKRAGLYADRIAAYLSRNRSVIVLVSDKSAIEHMRARLASQFPDAVRVLVREGKEEISQWTHIRNSHPVVVIGARSAVFAPVRDLGCIIIDDEHDYGYKQDQTPHYHSRTVALMRCEIEHADCIAGSVAPSLEMMHAVACGTAAVEEIARSSPYPEVRIVDMKKVPMVSTRQKITISGFVQDAILATLAAKGRSLLFFNRKGYATLAVCSHCAKIFQCPRCNVPLHFYYEENIMRCHYCNYSAQPPTICSECNAGYVRFLGAGAEKLESELSRIFPHARITLMEGGTEPALDAADICISTQAAIRHTSRRFDLVVVIGIDNALNYVDFRSAEKAFGILSTLACLADKRMVVQTNMPNHYVFDAVVRQKPEIFYAEELRQRKQLLFPPYRAFALVKVRSRIEEKAEKAARDIYGRLSQAKHPGVSLISVNPAQQKKLRGNFYWTILAACRDAVKLSVFLRKQLTKERHSGIIVTVDVDPV